MHKNQHIRNVADMKQLGIRLARVLKAGDILALTGDLGAGKTTLSRAIIQAVCGDINVPSPTYTLVQTYDTSEFEIWHCDLYRLECAKDVYELGLLEVMDEVVSLIEWPERIEEFLPDHALTLQIRFDNSGRMITFSGNDHWLARLDHV